MAQSKVNGGEEDMCHLAQDNDTWSTGGQGIHGRYSQEAVTLDNCGLQVMVYVTDIRLFPGWSSFLLQVGLNSTYFRTRGLDVDPCWAADDEWSI